MGGACTDVEIDPRSAGFRWRDRPPASGRLLSPAQVEMFNREGWCLLRDVAPSEAVASLLEAIDPIEARVNATVLTLDGAAPLRYEADSLTFARNVTQHAPVVREFCRSAVFQGLAHDLLGTDVRLYWDQAVYKKPRKGPVFPWHQDNAYTFTEPQDYLTCWLPLTPATLRNGCPWVVPGLHRRGTLAHAESPLGLSVRGLADDESSAVPLEAAPGDVIVFSSLTPHRTGANDSEDIRKAFIVQFMVDGTTQVDRDGTRRPQNDPDLNMWVLREGKAAGG